MAAIVMMGFALLIAVFVMIVSGFMLRMAALVVVIMVGLVNHTRRHASEDAGS
ncbi:MAG: hypothetical protein NWR08_04435 [Opitutales bacterium]|nr:hypothetical protein [Opitutales bacterium]